MQIHLNPLRPDQHLAAIKSGLPTGECGAVWAVSSPEPQLQLEAADQARQILFQHGFNERTVDFPDRSFDWNFWMQSASAPSLFNPRRLIEIRLPTGRPGTEGSKVLASLIQNPINETLVMIHLPGLDKSLIGAPWIKVLSQSGFLIIADPVPQEKLSDWIAQRLERFERKATPEAISLLIERCEGNLSAAHQEIFKLGFTPRPSQSGLLNLKDLQEVLSDHARFSPFMLGEVMRKGPASRSIRVLRSLKEEGEPLPLLLWSISQACRQMPSLRSGPLLKELSRIDTMVKGLLPEDPWLALERLSLRMSNTKTSSAHERQ